MQLKRRLHLQVTSESLYSEEVKINNNNSLTSSDEQSQGKGFQVDFISSINQLSGTVDFDNRLYCDNFKKVIS